MKTLLKTIQKLFSAKHADAMRKDKIVESLQAQATPYKVEKPRPEPRVLLNKKGCDLTLVHFTAMLLQARNLAGIGLPDSAAEVNACGEIAVDIARVITESDATFGSDADCVHAIYANSTVI